MEFEIGFIISAFVAGVLMFLAPCTLPLVPAYLAFIAGVKPGEHISPKVHHKIIYNSLFYILGFTVVFIIVGVLAGLAGVIAGTLKQILVPLAGVLIIIFSFQMLHVLKINRLMGNFHLSLPKQLLPGSSLSAFVIGAAFALGWTPCVGPILATILLLAGSSETIFSGAFLLLVFSIGLAIPFFVTAILYANATGYIASHQKFIKYTEIFGGVFLFIIGVLLLTNNFELTVVYGYKLLEFLGIGNLLDYY